VADLEAAGYITRTRDGRRTRYTVNADSRFRHPAQEGLRVGPLLDVLAVADDNSPHRPGIRPRVSPASASRPAGPAALQAGQ
jgi:hypothetical protein